MASASDPIALAVEVAGQALRLGVKVAGWGERQVLSILESGTAASPSRDDPLVGEPPGDGLDAKMRRLLDRSVEQSSTSGRQELFHKILDQMVPDEARIVGALSDGSASPLVSVYQRSRAGLVGAVVLENMSLVGKTANLALPHLTPTYVSHLLALGLVETGPADPSMNAEYEMLEADTTVQRAVRQASRGKLTARVERYSLRLSGLGLELWAAANNPRT